MEKTSEGTKRNRWSNRYSKLWNKSMRKPWSNPWSKPRSKPRGKQGAKHRAKHAANQGAIHGENQSGNQGCGVAQKVARRACCKAGPSSNLGSAPQRRPSTELKPWGNQEGHWTSSNIQHAACHQTFEETKEQSIDTQYSKYTEITVTEISSGNNKKGENVLLSMHVHKVI